MKHIFKLFSLIIAFVLVSCSGSEPKDLADKAAGYIQDKDSKALVEMISGYDEMSEQDQEMCTGLVAKSFAMMDKKDGLKDYEVLEEKIDGEKATVKMKYVYGNGDEDEGKMKFEKKDGKWGLLLR